MDVKKKTNLFKALSDEKRIAILRLLHQEEQCACVLLDQLELTQSGLSYHMKILTEANLVIGRIDGKWVHYSINPLAKERAIATIKEIFE